MSLRLLRLWISLLALVFTVGCFSPAPGGNGRTDGSDVEVLITAQYQKRILGAGGWSGTENRPARYCWAEVRQDSDDTLVAAGYLDAQGRGTVRLPVGLKVYLRMSACVEVPGSGGTPAGRGSVKLSEMPEAYADTAAFTKIPDVDYVPPMTETYTVTSGLGLNLTVPASDAAAGAFNIADQIATFHSQVDFLENGQLKVPSVHAFWSTGHKYTGFPEAALDASRRPLLTDDPHRRNDEAQDVRATFQFQVYRGLPNGPDAGADAFNDSVLQQSLCHLLFQEYGASNTGATLIRRDNDDAYLSRNIQSEPAAAFVSGFCDFLSCAFRNSSSIQDIDLDGTVRTFYLDRHAQFPMATGRGEFYSGAVAVSLYGIWKNVFTGTREDLRKLYNAAAFSKGPGEYNNAVIGCYPTYLVGLRALAPTSWSAMLGELSRENIGDVTTSAYFGSGALWTNQSVPFQVNGSVSLDVSPDGVPYRYDWIAQKTYRFVQSGTSNRRLTLTYPGGRDMILDVYNTAGLIGGSATTAGATSRQVDLTLTPGEYLVRVRAGYHNASAGTWNFTLSLQ